MSTARISTHAHSNKRAPLPRAIGYLRASSDMQETSCNDQRKAIERAAKGKYKIVDWCSDDGVSGWKVDERLGFQKAIVKATTNAEISLIVCWKQNRFSRLPPRKLMRFLDELEDANVRLYTLDAGEINPDDIGHGVATWVRADQDARYSQNLSTDTRRGQMEMARQGYWSGVAPLGYKLDGPHIGKDKGYKLVINEKEAAIVRRMFAMYLAGESTVQIAKQFNAEQVPTMSVMRGIRKKKGYTHLPPNERPYHAETWTHTTVASCLRNKTVTGDLHYGEKTRSTFGHDETEVVFVPDSHEAIVSREDFDRVAQLKVSRGGNRRVQTRRADAAATILSGLLTCGKCGGVMHRADTRRDDNDSAYGCHNSKIGKCDGNRVYQKEVLSHVVSAIVGHFTGKRVRKELQAAMYEALAPAKGVDTSTVESELQQRRSELKTAQRNLALVSPENLSIVEDTIRGLQDRVNELEATLTNASTPRSEFRRIAKARVDTALKAYDELEEAFHSGDVESLRKILVECVAEVVVDVERQATRRQFRLTGGIIRMISQNVQKESARLSHVLEIRFAA